MSSGNDDKKEGNDVQDNKYKGEIIQILDFGGLVMITTFLKDKKMNMHYILKNGNTMMKFSTLDAYNYAIKNGKTRTGKLITLKDVNS